MDLLIMDIAIIVRARGWVPYSTQSLPRSVVRSVGQKELVFTYSSRLSSILTPYVNVLKQRMQLSSKPIYSIFQN